MITLVITKETAGNLQCALEVLERAARYARADGNEERAEVLDHVAELIEHIRDGHLLIVPAKSVEGRTDE